MLHTPPSSDVLTRRPRNEAAVWNRVDYPSALLVLFGIVFVAMGISPIYRQDWALENVLVVVAAAILIGTRNRIRFSNLSYSLIFVFLVLHEVGSHYTYSLVPYDAWFRNLTGTSLSEKWGLDRNHYDRVIHFAYGALLLWPARELLRYVSPARGAWSWLLPIALILANSVAYELIEWAAAIVFGGELGTAYLGTQGDEWDAQKDMAFAAAGAVLAMALVLTLPTRRVAGRWHDEFRPPHHTYPS
jgi:putative membrane protein